MNKVGAVIARLRKARGLSQTDLGRASGISGQTVKKAENDGSLRGPTLLLIYRGLNKASRLTDSEAEEFRELTGLTALPNPDEIVDPRRATPKAISLREFTHHLSPDEARCYWMLADLIEQSGVTKTLNALEVLAKFANMVIEPPVPMEAQEHDSTWEENPMLGAPPYRRPDGATEQHFYPASGARTTKSGESTRATKSSKEPPSTKTGLGRKHA